MGRRVGSAMVMMLGLAAASSPPAPPPPPSSRTESVTVFHSLTMRIPLLRRAPAPPQSGWIEKRGPKCIPVGAIAGTAVAAPDAVDFVLRGGMRVRARLDGACPALGFYGGFYMSRTEDGLVCADRDAIHTRAGGECAIDRFRRLEAPKPGKP